jgi:ABC-2 type transport system ATP-binding protein
MTPLQFLNFIARIRGYKSDEKAAKIQRVVEHVELQEVLDKLIDNLFECFKRRVGLAQTLIHDPETLILDEPTDGLNPNQKYQVHKLIKNLSRDKIVIISTHILAEMTAMCNRVMIIAKGKLLSDDSPKALNRQSKYYGAVALHFSYRADDSELGGVRRCSRNGRGFSYRACDSLS